MSYIGNTVQNQSFVPTVDYFSGDGSTTAFTLSHPVGSVYELEVVVNNVQQNPSSAYTVDGSTITFTSAPSSGSNNIYVYYVSPNTQVIQPGQGTVGSAQLASGAALANIGAGNITASYLAAGVAIPAGAVQHFAMSTAPTGWLAANGAAVSRTTYATLFSAIGTTFGTGDGSTTFNLPNLGGQFIRSWESGQTTDSGRVFGSNQADDFKSHVHQMPNQAMGLNGTAGSSMWTITSGPADTAAQGGTETRPVNVALLACIKY